MQEPMLWNSAGFLIAELERSGESLQRDEEAFRKGIS